MRPVHVYKFNPENNIPVFVTTNVDESLINIPKVLKSVRILIPENLYVDSLFEIYIGKFDSLKTKGVDSTYNKGYIYISSSYLKMKTGAERKLARALTHEIGHAFESQFYDDIYEGSKISAIEDEFRKKKVKLFSELEEKGHQIPNEWIDNHKPNKYFEDFLKNEVGYESLISSTEDDVVSPYVYTSLSEYIATNFQYYFLGNRSRVKEYAPEFYELLEEIIFSQEN